MTSTVEIIATPTNSRRLPSGEQHQDRGQAEAARGTARPRSHPSRARSPPRRCAACIGPATTSAASPLRATPRPGVCACAQRRREPGGEGDHDTDEKADHNGSCREHGAAVWEVGAGGDGEGGERLGEPEAEEEAGDGGEQTDQHRLDDDRGQYLVA